MPVTNFFWDGDNLLQEYDDVEIAATQNVTEPTQFGRVISQRRNNEDRHIHYDGVGSTTEVTNSSGEEILVVRYNAFGDTVEQSGEPLLTVRFVGQFGYHFESDWNRYYVRRRVFVPSIGRWMSSDPASEGNGATSLFAYSHNAPLTYVDPSGLFVGAIWRWLKCFGSSKALYDCSVFMPQYTALESKCKEEVADISKWMKWREKCPDQITLLFNIADPRHSILCCTLHKANDDPEIDIEDFKMGFVQCLKGMKLGMDIINAILPRPS